MRSFRRRSATVAVVGLLACGATAVGASGLAGAAPRASRASRASRAEHLPAGFTDTVVATIPTAIALAETPDGRMLVADQTGKLWVIDNGVVLPKPALDISAKVCSGGERGLLGVAVDPSFATNGFVYLYYTFKKFGNCATLVADLPVERIARFRMVGERLLPASEKVLVDGIPNDGGFHNAGMLGFGHDGMLYASVGDGGCDYTGATGCDGNNGASRLDNVLLGKVLRITPTGGIPADNPFIGPGTARCNQGPIAVGLTCRETYLHGLRNPFRFAFDPNAAGTRLFVDDVGQATWEEIDEAVKGADYGWNVREGDCVRGSMTDCGPPPEGMTNPIFSYPHTTGCGAITGGAFVPGALWGKKFASGYLYADYVCDKLFLLSPDGAGGWKSTPFAKGLAPGGPVALLFAPHSAATALYYTTYANGGEVHVIDKP